MKVEDVKNQKAETQQTEERKPRSYKGWVILLSVILFLVLLNDYIGCGSRKGRWAVNSTFEERVVSPVDEAISDVVTSKESIDGRKVDETRGREYDSIGLYRRGKKWGFYNRNTQEMMLKDASGGPQEYDNVGFFSCGLAAVQRDGKIGFVDMRGNMPIPFSYLSLTNDNVKSIIFLYGYCKIAGRDGRFGVIDKRGNWMIQPIYTDLSLTESCVFASTATTRVQLAYDGTVLHSDMMVRVEPLQYAENVTGFHVYYVCTEEHHERCGLMDKEGQRLTAPIYRRIEALGNNLFRCYLLDGVTIEVRHF